LYCNILIRVASCAVIELATAEPTPPPPPESDGDGNDGGSRRRGRGRGRGRVRRRTYGDMTGGDDDSSSRDRE